MFDLKTDDGRRRLVEKLNDGVVVLKFTKRDGGVREMNAALGEMAKLYFQELERHKGFYQGGVIECGPESAMEKNRKRSNEVLSVIDVELREWRSIRWVSITHIDGVRVK